MRMPPVLRRRPVKIVLGLLITVLALQLFACLALPSIVQSQLPAWVEKKSGHTMQMGKPSINPWAWSVEVPNVRLSTPQGQALLAFDRLFIDVSALDLLAGTVSLSTVDLQGLNMQAALLPDGQLNWSAFIQAFKPEQPDPNPEPPAFTLGHLNLQNAVLGFADQRTPDGFSTQVEQINLQLNNISTQANQQGQFTLKARTSFDALLHIQAQVALHEPAFLGQLNLEGANLAKLANLLSPWLPSTPPSGTVGLQAHFNVQLPKQGQPNVQVSAINIKAQHLKTQALVGKPSPALAVEAVDLKNASVNLGTHLVQFDGLSLQGVEALRPNGQAWLGLESIEVGPLQANWAERSAKLEAVTISGKSLAVERQTDTQFSIQPWLAAWKTVPSVQEENPPSQAEGKPWRYSVGKLGLALQQAQFQDESQQPTLTLGFERFELNTQNISHQLDQALPVQASVHVQQGGQLKAKGTVTPNNGAMRLDVDLNALNLQPFQPLLNLAAKLSLAQGTLSAKGTLRYANTLEYEGQLAVNNVRLNHEGSQQTFLTLGSLNTPKLQASPSQVRIPTLNVQELNTALLIAKDKTTNLARVVRAPSANAKPSTRQAQPGLDLSVGQVNVSNSKLVFSDESLITPFATHIHNLQGKLADLSTKTGTHSTLNITGEIDEFGWAQAQGQLDLFNPLSFLNVKVKFENVEMGRLSPYSATFANRKIESGKLNLNLGYQLKDKQLNSTNQVSITKLVLGEHVQNPQASDLPLDLAIALLQDSDGRINLDLPISGNLSDPDISYRAIVGKAIGNVLTKAVTAPFRALAALFGREEPLVGPSFLAGENTLLPPQRERVQELAQALLKRPNLALTIHGAWSQADQDALVQAAGANKKSRAEQLQAQLTGLAQQRQNSVLESLRLAGVPTDQLKTGDIRRITSEANQAIVLELDVSTK